MLEGLQDKSVVITAGAAGIGRAIAEAFLDAGARVHLCDIDEAALAQARAALPSIDTTHADVAEPDQVDRLFDAMQARFGRLDILVNNAGVAGPTGPLEDCAVADWRRTLAVNLDGTYLCLRRAIPLMKRGGGGAIVNIASTAGLLGYPLRVPYAAAKWAVVGLTKSLAMELGPHGIRVNAICPGCIEGPRMERVIAAEAGARGLSTEAVRQGYMQQCSLRRFMSTQDIAAMAVYLCSEAGATISGQALAVDGHAETLAN